VVRRLRPPGRRNTDLVLGGAYGVVRNSFATVAHKLAYYYWWRRHSVDGTLVVKHQGTQEVSVEMRGQLGKEYHQHQ
jgi:hypothetical protein